MKNKLNCLNDKSNLSLTSTTNKSVNKSKSSAFKDKKLLNNQSSQDKKSLNNIATIFQMNNLKKDFKNIFNNELVSSDKFNKKADEDYEFIIPLNNSIDEKIGLDKIEFIDQRDFFANLNKNNLEALNKKTTADHTVITNFQTNHVSVGQEKTEKMNFEFDSIISNNANEDMVNMRSNKKGNLDLTENNAVNYFNNHDNKFNFFDFNKFNNSSHCDKQFNDNEIVKVKNSNPAAYALKVNSMINNATDNSRSKIKPNLNSESKAKPNKAELSSKTLNVACDYEENVFEEKPTNVIVIEKIGEGKFAPLSRYNSKQDCDSSFVKNKNNLSLKQHFRVNSCDYAFLNSKRENPNEKQQQIFSLNSNKLKQIQDKCDMETHHQDTVRNDENNTKTHKKANSEYENKIPSYGYYQMKNCYKNIENYASPNLDNTILKHKQQTLENIEKENLSKFLLNTYLSNLTQEKYEKDLLNFSNMHKSILLNSYNNPEDNSNLNNYISIKEKLEEIRFSNFNNNNISPTKNKSISSNLFCNTIYENFQNDSLESVRGSNPSFPLINKKVMAPKTYGTIQSQTESENKTLENHNLTETRRISKPNLIASAYEKKSECACLSNLNPNASVKFEDFEGKNNSKAERSEINVCPECEVHQIPKADLVEVNLYNQTEDQYLNNFIPVNDDNKNNNRNNFNFFTSLKNSRSNPNNNYNSVNNNNLSNIAQNFSSNGANNNYGSNPNFNLRNSSNLNNLNNTNFYSQMQTGFLNTYMSNPFNNYNNNNFLHTRSNSNNLAQNNNNNFMSVDNSNLLSEAHLLRQSRSLNNNQDFINNPNRLMVNSRKGSNANEENKSMEKARNTNLSLNNEKDLKYCTFSKAPSNLRNIENNQNYNHHSENESYGNYNNNPNINGKMPFAYSNAKHFNNGNNNNNNNHDNTDTNDFSNFKFSSNFGNNNNNNNNNRDDKEIQWNNLSIKELNSTIKNNYQSVRDSAEKKIFYSCSPPSSIRKRKSNLQSQSRFFSLKQQINNSNGNINNNSQLNNTCSLEEFKNSNNNEFNETDKFFKLLDLTKECILLKNGKTNAELLNNEYEGELKVKNLQLEKLKNSLLQNKLRSEHDRTEIKRLEMTIGILNSKIENLKNEKQGKTGGQKMLKTNASFVNQNISNISNYLSSSLNKSCLVNRKEMEIKKSIRLINKNIKKPKIVRSKKDLKEG